VGKSRYLAASLDDVSLSRFHLRAAVVSGMGFFTDAYDLFVIGIAATLVQQQWHTGTVGLATLTSMTLGAAFLGAFVFGRIADLIGRTRVYWLVAVILVAGALASALAPSFWVLVLARFVLGLGIGGDYPVSAVLMSEYANRRDRGKLVGMVFAAQALGLIVGPLVALSLLGGGVSHALAWRVMLGLGAVPALAVLYWRRAMPESPRYQEQVRGTGDAAAAQLAEFTGGAIGPDARGYRWRHGMSLRLFWSFLKYRYVLLGTAGTWFLFDYAYYGNTISAPRILEMVSPHASLLTITALQLAIFAVAAVPGYLLAVATMDRIGHRRLQWIGFAMMGGCFALAGLVPGASAALAPFLILFGVSYFFAEFGPNTTLFVLPAELYPVSVRATGHGISSGIAKLGAFTGVFAFGFVQASLGLRGTLILCAVIAAGGALLTLVLEEPARRSLEEVAADDDVVGFTDEAAGPGASAGLEAGSDHEVSPGQEAGAAVLAYPEGELSGPSSPRR
jgi:MFS family permease